LERKQVESGDPAKRKKAGTTGCARAQRPADEGWRNSFVNVVIGTCKSIAFPQKRLRFFLTAAKGYNAGATIRPAYTKPYNFAIFSL
jgi:hypothetical protein